MSATKTDAAPVRLELAEKTHRPLDAIDADLAKLLARYLELEPLNRDHGVRVNGQKKRREKLETKWKAENPGEPFDPSLFTPPATVAPARTPLTDEFHAIHYAIDRLKAELEAARKAAVTIGV